MRALAILILMAGCASTSPPAPVPAAVPCPQVADVVFTCDGLPLTLVPADAAPDLQSGWYCTIDHDDEAPREFFKLYRHQDGRLGYHWRWALPEWDHRFVALALMEPDRTTWALGPYQHEGFVVFPATPESQEGLALIQVLALRLDEMVDGAWRPIEGAHLEVGTGQGVGYFVWNWLDEEGPVHLDIMAPHEERVWTPDSNVTHINGRAVSAAVRSPGSSFEAQYWGPDRIASNDCTTDGLPAVVL